MKIIWGILGLFGALAVIDGGIRVFIIVLNGGVANETQWYAFSNLVIGILLIMLVNKKLKKNKAKNHDKKERRTN